MVLMLVRENSLIGRLNVKMANKEHLMCKCRVSEGSKSGGIGIDCECKNVNTKKKEKFRSVEIIK